MTGRFIARSWAPSRQGSKNFGLDADLPKIENIKIPRSYFTVPFDNVELHMFGDSSQDIFSAVAFLRSRVMITTGEVKTACVRNGESAHGAYQNNNCFKTGIASLSTCCSA